MAAIMGAGGRIVLLVACAAMLVNPVGAQTPVETLTPLAIPDSDYQTPALMVGSTAVRLTFDLATMYDSNVYAARDNRQDDAIAQASALVAATRDSGRVRLDTQAYAVRNQHVDIGRESSTSFGAFAKGEGQVADQQLTGAVRFDRAIQSRGDPEARLDDQLSPRRINIVAVDAGDIYRLSRLQLQVAGAFRSYDFLEASDADRDLRSYEGFVRIARQAAGPFALFVQPYVVRRDFRRQVDFSGVDRDSITAGGLVGISREVSGALRGQIGAGVFHAMPDSPTLRPFTGFAASGQITWTPQQRTVVTGNVFSGDVATIQIGATGRQDTIVGLRIDQEVRHNLAWNSGIAWIRNRYRDAPSANRETLRFEFGVNYLVTRALSLFVATRITHRTAAVDINSFNRQTVSVGLRLRH